MVIIMRKMNRKSIKLKILGHIKRIYIVLFILLFSISISSAATLNTNPTVTIPSSNLAPNSGFETDPAVDYFTHGNGTFTWTTDAANNGSSSTKIVSSQPAGSYARWLSKTDIISGQANNDYSASVWMKTINVAQYGMLVINFWDESLNYLGGYESDKSMTGTSDWTEVTVQGNSPSNTSYARIEFRLYGPGELWIDDVNLSLTKTIPTPVPSSTPTPVPTATPSGYTSDHPGMYLNANEIDAIIKKVDSGQQPWKEAYDKFMNEDVPAALNTKIQSVTYGGKVPPSGDIHDYFSETPYTSDGVYNPYADKSDYYGAIAVGKAVRNLGLAYALTGENKYADKAVQLINAWSVNPETRMNPKFTDFNGQSYVEIPITLTGMFYGADLIWNYQGWNVADKNVFKSWVGDISTSRGRSKESTPTNYENWKVLFVSSSAVITGDNNDMDWAFQYWKELVPIQMDEKGQMVNELRRTRSLFYSLFSINAMTQTAEIARHRGIDLYNYKTDDGRGLELAFDFHAPYLAGKENWPYQEIRPDLLEYATFEFAYSFKQKPYYKDVIDKAGRPVYEKRIMGPVTLTHAK